MIQHRNIFNTVRDAIFIADIDTGMIVDANRAAEDLCGRSLEELRSMHHTGLHPPEAAGRAREAFEENTRIPGLSDGLILHKDGHRIPIEVAASHFTGTDGRRMLVGIFRDTTERDRARESLRQAEERFRQVAESAGEFIWEVDAEGLYVYASPMVAEILGYTPEEVVGRMHFYDFFVPETRESVKKAAFDAFSRKEPFRAFLNWNLKRDGTLVAFETSGFPVLDGNGNLLGYRGADTDVTERKRTEEALRESEDLYRTLFDQSADCVFLLDPSAGVPMIVAANGAALKSHGYSREEMIGQPISLIEPEISQESLDARMRLIAEGKPFCMVHRRKDGSEFEVESAARLVRIGARELLLAVGRDITKRKQAEQALVRQNEFIRAALDNISDGVVACDADGNLALFNRAAREWHGIDALKLPPDQWSSHYDLFGPDGKTPLATNAIPLRRAFNGEHIRDVGMTIAARDRPLRHLLASGCPFFDHDGNKLGAVAAMHDITERRQAEEALRRSEMIYRAIGESIEYGVWVCAPDGRNTYASESFLNLVGLTQEQCSNFGWGSVLHPDDAENTIAAWKRCVATEGRWDIEHRFRGVDGEWHPVLARGVPVRDEHGEITCWAGLNLDISTLKQTQESLRAREAQARAAAAELQAIMDAAPALILIAQDVECRHISGNRTAHVLLRQPPASNFSMAAPNGERPTNHRLMMGGVEIPSCEAPLHIAARTGQPTRNYELSVAFDDGTSIDLLGNVVPLLDDNGSPQGAVAVLSDITERKQTERALREGEQQLASIYNTVRDVIFYLAVEPGGQFRFVSVNAAFLRVTGLSQEAVVGKTVDEIIPAPSLTMALAKYRQAIEEQTVVSWEETSDYPTGRLTGDISIAPLFDHNGNCTHLVGSVHDITERKRAEAALKESEERFRTVADTAPVMIWMAGLDKLCTFFNRPWLEFTGRTSEQEMGDGWLSGVHPDDLDRCLATYSSAFDTHLSFKMEYRLRRADGEYRWVLDNGTPRYREGEFAGYIGSCIDVTEQKAIEGRLRANEIRLKEAQRLAKVGSWERDLETGTVHWSDEILRMFGPPYDPPPDFRGMLERSHPKDREKILAADAKVRSSVGPVDVEHRVVLPNGNVRVVRSIVEAVRNDAGAPIRIVGATQDITEQVKATERLRESEARLKTAERMTHAGNWVFYVKTSRTSWSEGLHRILGLPQDHNPSYEGVLQMMAPADRDRVERWVKDCLAQKKGSFIEARIVRPDGDVRTVACMSEVLLDEDGSPEQIFGTCQDVTDARREQEESFARQKLESVGTLASGIAHDFNNLLGAVLAQTELAMAELAAGSQPDEELNEIRDVAIRGSEIVRQLMVYAGKEGDVLELVNLSKAVEGTLGFLKVTVSKNATLTTDLGENLPPVKARAAQLRQIVMNLVLNASDAMKDREGMIRVTSRSVTIGHDPASATFQNLAPGEYVQLEVSDTGRGMSPETQAKVFDPFFTTKSAGRGLGLAVVQGIVRSLNGAIRVVSELNKGTTFEILLPCAEIGTRAAADIVTEPDRVSDLSPKATVLIVEDEDPLRLAVAKMLRKAGFGVLGAANGSDAIAMLRARTGEIDVILLDMTIPGAPSHEVLAEAAQVRPNMKVILTSAYSEEMAKAVLSGPQVCGFVRKPFEFGKLMQVFRNAIGSKFTP